jgi:hypothetical protein
MGVGVFVYAPPLRQVDFSGIPAVAPLAAQGFMAWVRTQSVEDALAGLDMISHGNLGKKESLESLVGLIANAYAEWNLSFPDGDGQVAPLTVESLKRLDKAFLLGMVRGWIQSNVEVPIPLAESSTGTALVPEGSLPMDVSTPNQPS